MQVDSISIITSGDVELTGSDCVRSTFLKETKLSNPNWRLSRHNLDIGEFDLLESAYHRHVRKLYRTTRGASTVGNQHFISL